MPYIPTSSVLDTVMSPHDAVDLITYSDYLVEMMLLAHPRCDYYMLDLLPTAVTSAGEKVTTGAAPRTTIDAIYGETIPTRNGAFSQPHGTGTEAALINATASRVHKAAVRDMPLYYKRLDVSRGSDGVSAASARKFELTWPTPLLDRYGVTVNIGDEIQFGNQRLEIKESYIPDRGYWKYTNIPLYIRAFASLRQTGS